eukprot:COSAG02_NODE_2555_length_8532_cov_7.259900_2_plen_42_part_00
MSRRLRMWLSIAEERVKVDARESTQHTMLRVWARLMQAPSH